MNFQQPLIFLINILVTLYACTFFARFILQMVRADFYNPLSQFVVKFTNPLLIPLRRVIPGFGGLDIASLVLFVVFIYIKVIIIALIIYHGLPAPVDLILFGLKNVAKTVVDFFWYTIMAQVILSWVSMLSQGMPLPIATALEQLNEPILGPLKKLIPPMGGLDISPIFAFILLMALQQMFAL